MGAAYSPPQKATPRREFLGADQVRFWMLIDRDLTAERFERNKHQTLEASMDMEKRMLQEILEDQDAKLSNAIKYDGRVSPQWKARFEPRKT